ncbi:LysR family transcriptional regulator, partial [Burkholderia gladioli]|nr:LysR family transcriptional regulator [Burkholderia gladioli]
MSTSITLRQIEYFVSVADTGQISQSANLCAVSQSSMTIALKKLEDAVGTALLQRHSRGVRLTQAGERFLRHVQHAAISVDRAVAAAQDVPEQVAGQVRIGVTETISAYLMPSLMSAVAERYGKLSVSIVESERETIEAMLADDRLDIAL